MSYSRPSDAHASGLEALAAALLLLLLLAGLLG